MAPQDVKSDLKQYNSVIPLKSAGIFDDIVIAVPDVIQSDIIKEYANYWQVSFFKGDNLNIAKRIFDCTVNFNAETVVRVLAWWFFVDISLIYRLILFLEKNKLDYVLCPTDFDIRFAADVTNKDFYFKVHDSVLKHQISQSLQ